MVPITLKVLTYNIHKGFNFGNTRFVLHQIRDLLHEVNADIIFLQEIHGAHKKHEFKILEWPKESQFEFLADQLWPHFAYGKNAIYKSGHHGNAILSKFAFATWENIDVSISRRASRSLLHGVIEIPNSKTLLHVICVHFGFIKFERNKQIDMLCERILSHVPVDAPLIIAGDFNDWSYTEREFENTLGLQEIFKNLRGSYAKSFPAWQPSLPIDRIYFRGVKAELCHRFHQSPYRNLSDHLPLFAEFLV
jgi:endonuclease/exonuclease/phosphatase family metal-dependent hydrolase